MMASSSNADNANLERVRLALQAAKLRQAGGIGQDAVFMTLAALFNDLEDALEMGVTQAEVLAILAKNGMPMPRTRFSKHMYMLRQVVERRPLPEAQPDMVKAKLVSDELKECIKDVGPVGGARRRRAQIKPQRKQTAPVKAPDKILAVAEALVSLAKPDASPEKIGRHLRAHLGPGWTVKTAVQFGHGPNYTSWIDAHWPNPAQRDLVARGRDVAARIAEATHETKSLPDIDQMLRIAQEIEYP